MANLAGEEFTVMHLLLLFSARLSQGGMVELEPHGSCSLLGDLSDSLSQGFHKTHPGDPLGPGWLSLFVAIVFGELRGVSRIFLWNARR